MHPSIKSLWQSSMEADKKGDREAAEAYWSLASLAALLFDDKEFLPYVLKEDEEFWGEVVELRQSNLESRRRSELLQQTNDAYAALRADPEAWSQELAERGEWDATLSDGQ